jgi:hypothetical protein
MNTLDEGADSPLRQSTAPAEGSEDVAHRPGVELVAVTGLPWQADHMAELRKAAPDVVRRAVELDRPHRTIPELWEPRAARGEASDQQTR